MSKPYPLQVGDYVISSTQHLRGRTFQVTVVESDTHVVCAQIFASHQSWAVDHDEPVRRLLRAELVEVCPNHSGGDPECHLVRKRGLHEGTLRIVA